jgi:hypothetical protein
MATSRSPRSIKASKHGLIKINEKFQQTGWDQSFLAGKADTTRQTVNKMLAGHPVDKKTFKQVCSALNLEWGDIVLLEEEKVHIFKSEDIDKVVALMKQDIRKYIEHRCSKMRVLDMTYPIGVNQIYTDVNILEKIASTQWKEISELQQRVNLDRRNFDRLSGGTPGKRVLGEDAVNIQHRLVVLGNPGSGKTTFLKYLAIQCLNNNFQFLRVPIFITLKEYAESNENLSVISFIKKELREFTDENNIDLIFRQGRVLILLDGLDEVKEEDQERICEQIESFTRTASELTEDFIIDREKNDQERSKLQEQIKKIEIDLIPRKDLEDKILKLKQRTLPNYIKNSKKISNKEEEKTILQIELQQIELLSKSLNSKDKFLNDESFKRVKKKISGLEKEINQIKGDQEIKKKDMKILLKKLHEFYTDKIKHNEYELDYRLIFQYIYSIYCEKLVVEINKLDKEIEPIRNELNLSYPDLDIYLDKGLSFLSKKFPERIYQNRFILTCRIALSGVNFTDFTSVEIADFDENQIRTFAKNWFTKEPEKKKDDGHKFFMEKLSQNESVRELATSPLLLTLLCLVFEDAADFPKNRSELYKEGVSILLKKWDADRFIYRRRSEKEIYKELSPNRKEDLLSEIAGGMFEKGMYFFKRDEVEKYIANYIKNLPNAKNNPEILRADSEDILKYIELQHGLLVERAKGIYSFSHLTFQEYFTARKIVDTSVPSELENNLKSLSSHILDQNWREVFLLAIGMLSNAGFLLTLMKNEIDIMIAGDLLIQNFLIWVNRCTSRVDVSFKQSAIKAFYLKYAYDIALANSQTLKTDKLSAFKDTMVSTLDNKIDSIIVEGACFLGSKLHEANSRLRSRRDDPQFAIDVMNNPDKRITQLLAITDLDKIKNFLPNSQEGESFQKWWLTSGKSWNESLFSIAQHPNINHDFKFNGQEEKNFKRYYNANSFLIECLYSDCVIDANVRKKIEEGLFLPFTILEEKEEILLGTKELDIKQQDIIRAKWSRQ